MKCEKIHPPLTLWVDKSPRSVGEQMALDEALWSSAQAILRFHDWQDCCVTFGYFLRWKEAQQQAQENNIPSTHIQRRWTGGGLVIHQNGQNEQNGLIDQAFTLTIPTQAWQGKSRFQDSIFWIHTSLANALTQAGFVVNLVPQEQGAAINCFEHPVEHDLSYQGRKIAGAGQRRHRQGLLHQGSLQLTSQEFNQLKPCWKERVAQNLCSEIQAASTQQIQAWEAQSKLLQNKYQDEAWQKKR